MRKLTFKGPVAVLFFFSLCLYLLSHSSFEQPENVYNGTTPLSEKDLERMFNNFYDFFETGQKEHRRMDFIVHALPTTLGRENTCDMTTCFDSSRCNGDSILVYVYPRFNATGKEADLVVEGALQREQEYYDKHIVPFLKGSKYYTDDPAKACLLIPHITVSHQKWNMLPHWNEGANHIFFVWHQQDQHHLGETDKAIIAKTSWRSALNHRSGFDIDLPLEAHKDFSWKSLKPINKRPVLLSFKGRRYTSGRGQLRNYLRTITSEDKGSDIRICLTCRHQTQQRDDDCNSDEKQYYNKTLCDFQYLARNSKFSLVPGGRQFASYRLAEVLSTGSIPVFLGDGHVLPFPELISWPRLSLYISMADMHKLPFLLRKIHPVQLQMMSAEASRVFAQYFKGGVPKVVESALSVVAHRLKRLAEPAPPMDWQERHLDKAA
eukprot:Colp12_sorted_trinity150504_noHs@3983